MPVSSNSSRLLIVEDDGDTRDILETVLREEGYMVAVAASPQEAARLLDEQVFHFILTDLFAEQADDSLQSVAWLRDQAQPTPIGVVTGWKISPEEARRAGFACCIMKPFDLLDLLTSIAACLHVPLNPTQQRQAKIIERFYAALNAREWEQALALCAAQFAYYPAPHSLYAPARRLDGKERYRAYVEDVFQRLSVTRFEDLVLYARPKGMAARYTYGLTLPDGTAQRRAGASLFRFRGDRVAQIGVKVRRERTRKLIERQHAAALSISQD